MDAESQFIADKDAQIAQLKAQHEDMLLKHAREQSVALKTLDAALQQIQEQNDIIESLSDHSSASERMTLLKAQDAQLTQLQAAYAAVLQSRDNAEDETDQLNAHIGVLRSLLTRTANWISDWKPLTYDRNQERLHLIDDLRAAACLSPQGAIASASAHSGTP